MNEMSLIEWNLVTTPYEGLPDYEGRFLFYDLTDGEVNWFTIDEDGDWDCPIPKKHIGAWADEPEFPALMELEIKKLAQERKEMERLAESA